MVPMLMVACREMTSGDRGVRVEGSRVARFFGRGEGEGEGGRGRGDGGWMEGVRTERVGVNPHTARNGQKRPVCVCV